MKIKAIALAVAIVATAIGSFQSSAAKRLGVGCTYKFNGTICMGWNNTYTNETLCSPGGTGAFCTVTPPGHPTVTAYQVNSNCLVPFRQPYP